MPLMRCHCGTEYNARPSDLKRGWSLSCSKSCAAIRRDYNKPKAKAVIKNEGVKKVKPSPSTNRPNDNRVYCEFCCVRPCTCDEGSMGDLTEFGDDQD